MRSTIIESFTFAAKSVVVEQLQDVLVFSVLTLKCPSRNNCEHRVKTALFLTKLAFSSAKEYEAAFQTGMCAHYSVSVRCEWFGNVPVVVINILLS